MGWFETDGTEINTLIEYISKYGDTARNVINDVLHGTGATEIKQEIARILPQSGRTWAGKKAPAASAMPGSFKQDNENLAVTIAARGTYHYLYFPDDGSNTVHHAGNQQFMLHGAENAQDAIIDTVTNKLTEDF